MHEMALAESVLQIIEDHARVQRFARVRTVWVEIGQLAGVEAEALSFCFDAVTRGTLAEHARLEILPCPGEAWCLDCEHAVALSDQFGECPRCGGLKLQITGGTQMRVKELEVE